jgi:hypothetical protein
VNYNVLTLAANWPSELPTTIAAVHVNAEAERMGPGAGGRRYRPDPACLGVDRPHFWACFVS